MRCTVLALLAALAACGADDLAPQPLKVAVYVHDFAMNCERRLPTGDDIAVSGACLDSPAASSQVAPGDVIELFIDYVGLAFTAGTTVPNPSVTLLVNGMATPIGVSTNGQSRTSADVEFQSSFTVPQTPFSSLSLQVQASPDVTRDPIVLSIEGAAPGVSLDECADRNACLLVSGSQHATIRVSAAGSAMQTATLHVVQATLGEILTQPVTLTKLAMGNRIEGTVPFDAPLAVDGTKLTFTADVGPARSAALDATLVKPTIDIRVAECTVAACTLFGGVTTAHVKIEMPNALKPTTVALRQILNGLPQPTTVPVVVDQKSPTAGLFGLAFVDAPAVAATATWQLQIEDGPFVQSSIVLDDAGTQTTPRITLKPPGVQLAVDPCPSSPCTMAAGTAQAAVTVTVDGTAVQHVAIQQSLGGVLQSAVSNIDAKTPTSGGQHMTGTGFITVPAAASGTTWTLIAVLGSQSASADVTLAAPSVSVALDACVQTPCTLVAGVGTTNVRVAVPGTLPQTVTLVSKVDGAVISSSSLTLSAQVAGSMVAVTSLDVPSRVGTWTVSASDGDGSDARSVSLSPPTVTAALACGSTCKPSAGGTTVVVVTAPLGLRDRTATASAAAVDGTPVLPTSPVNMTEIDNVAQTISGRISLPLPSAPGGHVLVTASVGGFVAPALVIEIGP